MCNTLLLVRHIYRNVNTTDSINIRNIFVVEVLCIIPAIACSQVVGRLINIIVKTLER